MNPVIVCILGFACVLISCNRAPQNSPPASRVNKIDGIVLAESEIFTPIRRFTDIEPVDRPRYQEPRLGFRAYPGSPPMIPHDVGGDSQDFGTWCVSCHGQGGFVPSMGKYAPQSPHPQLVHCKQCHVPEAGVANFKGSNFEPTDAPLTGNVFLSGGPPAIPHSLQLRENCHGCHGVNGGRPDLRTSHPERVHCRQCHVPMQEGMEFVRRGGQ